MADQGSENPGNLPVPTGGGGPPPTRRLPDWVTTQGPSGKATATGSESDSAISGSASAGGQLGSATAQGSFGTATARVGYGDASASGSMTRTSDSVSGSGSASAEIGALTAQGKTGPLAGGLADASARGRVLAADAKAEGAFKLSREQATLSGKLGASAVVAEAHAKGEIVITPQRIYNGIIVNGVNAFSEWRGYSYRMREIHNGAFDHGIVLSGEAGAQVGASLKADGHAPYTPGQGGSIGGSLTAAPVVGGTIGGSVGWK